MHSILQMKKLMNTDNYSGIKFGGGAYINGAWPQNPLGEDLVLLFTIETDLLNIANKQIVLPEGKFLSVFSTYTPSRYFLDDIIYTGDASEYKYIKNGFTKVTSSESNNLKFNNNALEEVKIELVKRELSDNDFPAFSFISKTAPKEVNSYNVINDEYNFIGQIYSADISPSNDGLLGLSDANGYLFLKNKIDNNDDAGFFFVQTA